MKFAKELEDDAVPEWRIKCLNYKLGKKKIKAVSRALKSLNKTPATPARPDLAPDLAPDERLPFTHYDFWDRGDDPNTAATGLLNSDHARVEEEARQSRTMFTQSPPIHIPGVDTAEGSSRTSLERPRNYGSIIGTPPSYETPGFMTSLELPDPALKLVRSRKEADPIPTATQIPLPPPPESPNPQTLPSSSDPYHVGQDKRPPSSGGLAQRVFKQRQAANQARTKTLPGPKLRRMFISYNLDASTPEDLQMSAYRELDDKQADFSTSLTVN